MARKVAGRGGTRKAPSGGKGAAARKGRGRSAQTKGVRDDRSDYRNKRAVEKIEAADKKNGCLPKLFMLALPFLAIGAFLIARLA